MGALRHDAPPSLSRAGKRRTDCEARFQLLQVWREYDCCGVPQGTDPVRPCLQFLPLFISFASLVLIFVLFSGSTRTLSRPRRRRLKRSSASDPPSGSGSSRNGHSRRKWSDAQMFCYTNSRTRYYLGLLITKLALGYEPVCCMQYSNEIYCTCIRTLVVCVRQEIRRVWQHHEYNTDSYK